jgi:hypothetical protein
MKELYFPSLSAWHAQRVTTDGIPILELVQIYGCDALQSPVNMVAKFLFTEILM